MAHCLSRYAEQCYRLGLMLLLLVSPLAQAEGLRSPEAVAQAFAQAYRSGSADAIVALQLFAADGRSTAAENHERQLWQRQMREQRMLSYRVANLLAQDQALLKEGALLPQKKLVTEYGGRNGRMIETYLIAQQDGLYYLLPAHDGQ